MHLNIVYLGARGRPQHHVDGGVRNAKGVIKDDLTIIVSRVVLRVSLKRDQIPTLVNLFKMTR